MTIGYNGTNKGIVKRIVNKLFHKNNLLPEAIQYTQKEVKVKMEQIINCLHDGFDFKNKYIEKFDNYIQGTNIYFYKPGQKHIKNNFDTYMCTVKSEVTDLDGNSKLIFSDPVAIKTGTLLEIYPVLNLAKVDRKNYLMQIYINTVKIIARKSLNPKKVSKESKKYTYLYGINSKEVDVFTGIISRISSNQYYYLNKAIVYIIAQILYESIENEPFLLDLSRKEEKIIKMVKYYISKNYLDYKTFFYDYLLCDKNSIEKNMLKNSKYYNLDELEYEIEKSLRH